MAWSCDQKRHLVRRRCRGQWRSCWHHHRGRRSMPYWRDCRSVMVLPWLSSSRSLLLAVLSSQSSWNSLALSSEDCSASWLYKCSWILLPKMTSLSFPHIAPETQHRKHITRLEPLAY